MHADRMSEITSGLVYPGIGGTRDERVPPGFARLVRAAPMGSGRDVLERVSQALLAWDVHRGAGLTVEVDGPAVPGRLVRLSLPGPLRRLPLSIDCRVVYVIDEPCRRGFGYGTVPGHPEEGEARFLVEMSGDRAEAPVTFSLFAFSRPGTRWARALEPALRVAQAVATQGYLRAARRSGRAQ